MFGEEEVEISELKSTPCKRKAGEKFVTPSSRRRVLPSSRKKKTRKAVKERGEKERKERGMEEGRERDKGNTGLASTQFPSLASNFRRILPSHSILPLYQHVSLHFSQLSRPSSPFLNRYLHSRLSLSSRSRRIPCIPLVSQPPLSVSVNASHQISGFEIEIHGIRVVAAYCNLVSKLKPAKYMRRRA